VTIANSDNEHDDVSNVRGRALPGGHNLPEELPEQTLSAILEFLTVCELAARGMAA
jgi:hypothetical protein